MKRFLIYPLLIPLFVVAVCGFSILYGLAWLLDREDRGCL